MRSARRSRWVSVETFGTGTAPDGAIQKAVLEVFDLRPAAIIADLDLLRPIYAQTAAYGHFGRELRLHLGADRPRRCAEGRRRRLTGASLPAGIGVRFARPH